MMSVSITEGGCDVELGAATQTHNCCYVNVPEGMSFEGVGQQRFLTRVTHLIEKKQNEPELSILILTDISVGFFYGMSSRRRLSLSKR